MLLNNWTLTVYNIFSVQFSPKVNITANWSEPGWTMVCVVAPHYWYSERRERYSHRHWHWPRHKVQVRSWLGQSFPYFKLHHHQRISTTSPALSALFINILRGRGISGFMDYRVLCSKHTTRKCTDIILKLVPFFSNFRSCLLIVN